MKKTKKIVIAVIAALIIVLGAAGGVIFFFQQEEPQMIAQEQAEEADPLEAEEDYQVLQGEAVTQAEDPAQNQVDFEELQKINPDVYAWIQIPGTNINYPFVQANDNKYYLTHSFDKSHNTSGWVFLDYRNNIQTLDKNTILYAHGRIDKTMFGTLKNILNNDWLTNTDNYIIKLSTEYENSLWQIFSAYHIPTTSDYLQINFENNEDFKNFANMLTERSQYNFNTTVNENDHILTLSTCYNSSEKMVIHAKLIKKETR